VLSLPCSVGNRATYVIILSTPLSPLTHLFLRPNPRPPPCQAWLSLPGSVRSGGNPSREEALQAVAVVNRVRRLLSETSGQGAHSACTLGGGRGMMNMHAQSLPQLAGFAVVVSTGNRGLLVCFAHSWEYKLVLSSKKEESTRVLLLTLLLLMLLLLFAPRPHREHHWWLCQCPGHGLQV